VPYKAGGGYDIKARIIAPLLAKYLPGKRNMVVLNVPGAGGTVGITQLARSKPDGYTLALSNPVLLATLQKLGNLGSVDPRTLTYLGQLEAVPSLVLIGTTGRLKSIGDMKGQEVRMGVLGDNNLVSAVFANSLGATPKLIAYDGLPEAAMAVARGDIDAVIGNVNTLYKQLANFQGKLAPVLLIGGSSPKLPDIKTAGQAGIKMEEETGVYRVVVVAPSSLPQDVQKALTDALDKATRDPEFAAEMEKAGYSPAPLGGSQLQAVVDEGFKVVEKSSQPAKTWLSTLSHVSATFRFDYRRKEQSIEWELCLDGIYVILAAIAIAQQRAAPELSSQ